jgi:hypothetical protein
MTTNPHSLLQQIVQGKYNSSQFPMHSIWSDYVINAPGAYSMDLNRNRIMNEIINKVERTKLPNFQGTVDDDHLFDQLKDLEDMHCWIWNGATTSGYPSVSVRLDRTSARSSKKIQMHQVAASYSKERWPLYKTRMPHASHRCHRNLCMKPNHLVWESQNNNKSREFCPCWKIVNDRVVKICTHSPKCFFPGKRAFDTLPW